MTGALAERHALVTGGARGLGGSIASALVAAGARVTLVGRDATALDAHAAKLCVTGEAQGIAADVTDDAAVTAAFARAAASFGPVEILINNAGLPLSAAFVETDAASWNAVIDVTLNGTYRCTRAAVDGMLAHGFGRIVNVASTAGLSGGSYISAYCAAKHGVVGLTRALAVEYAGRGITINAVCPGFIAGERFDAAIAVVVRRSNRTAQEASAAILTSAQQARLLRPEEVAAAVVRLASPSAEATTGATLVIDGSETPT